jgi:signal transduction histidine kinase
MKNCQIILLIILLSHLAIGQDVNLLQRKLSSREFNAIDSIKTLNLLARELTYVNSLLALDYADKALELSIKTNNPIGIAYAYRNLSGIYSFDESYFISMEYLQRALDIFKLENDSVGLANCYISLGHTNRRLQNRKEEVEYHLKAFNIFKVRNDIERIGVSAHNLGESYYNIGDLENSRRLTLFAIKINDSINKKPVLSSCYKVMGMIELKEKKLENAEAYFQKVLYISDQLGENSQKVATAESMIQLAAVNLIKGDLERQFKFLLLAAAFSSKNNLPKHLQRAYQELILYSSADKNQYAVREYVQSYAIISDSLNQKQLRDRRNLTKSVVEVHELSKSKVKLEEANLLQLQKIQSRNSTLAVIFVSVLILFWSLLKYVRVNKQLKAQNSTIAIQKNDLEVLNDTKDKFFNIVAHDLKSPLISLKSFSVLLINHFDHLNRDEILDMSRKLRDSVDNTIKMADNLITWASIQMNEYQYTEETFKVKDIASNVCELYHDVALKKEINLICSVADSISLIGDKNQIEFIIRNLVINAIKFTNKNGSVHLSAESLPNGLVQVAVSDNGVGIPEEMRDKLFTIGKKQSTTGTAGEKGTGLGLMLSYEFMKLNGGNIEIDSVHGKGTTFYLTFRAGD